VVPVTVRVMAATLKERRCRVAAMFVYVFLLLIADHPTGLMSGGLLFCLVVLCRFVWMWVVMY
jgi:hypothetical protein